MTHRPCKAIILLLHSDIRLFVARSSFLLSGRASCRCGTGAGLSALVALPLLLPQGDPFGRSDCPGCSALSGNDRLAGLNAQALLCLKVSSYAGDELHRCYPLYLAFRSGKGDADGTAAAGWDAAGLNGTLAVGAVYGRCLMKEYRYLDGVRCNNYSPVDNDPSTR